MSGPTTPRTVVCTMRRSRAYFVCGIPRHRCREHSRRRLRAAVVSAQPQLVHPGCRWWCVCLYPEVPKTVLQCPTSSPSERPLHRSLLSSRRGVSGCSTHTTRKLQATAGTTYMHVCMYGLGGRVDTKRRNLNLGAIDWCRHTHVCRSFPQPPKSLKKRSPSICPACRDARVHLVDTFHEAGSLG